VKLIPKLLARDLRVVCYDRLANDNVRAMFGSAAEYVHSAEECLRVADVAVFTLRDGALKQAAESFEAQKPLCVVDGWRFIDPRRMSGAVRYVPIGRHA
jgi:UDP-glucose 6-dehydrogenase